MAIHFLDYNATFIHIPKTGGSSFLSLVESNGFNIQKVPKHATLVQTKKIWDDVGTTFAFVRNPYDRMVSMFEFIGQRAMRRVERRSNNQKVKKDTNPVDDAKIIEYYKLGFNNWINDLYNKINNAYSLVPIENLGFDLQTNFTPTWRKNGINHYMRETPQVRWCEPDIDFVVKLENIENEFSKVQKLIGLNEKLPIKNKTVRDNYRTYYNDESAQIVAELFKEDFEAFDYSFEL